MEEYGLSANEWGVTFTYGIVVGKSKCSAKTGDNGNNLWGNSSSNWKATESELTSAGQGTNCWCKPTRYTPAGGAQCYVSSTGWLFMSDMFDCENSCAFWCMVTVLNTATFRSRMYKNL